MNLFDKMYEDVLVPLFEAFVNMAEMVVGWVIAIVMLITTPIWIIPYLVIRKAKQKRERQESGEGNENEEY